MAKRATVVRSSSRYIGKQGPTYAGGLSAESAGSEHLWLVRVEVPPGGRTKAHLHERRESAIYVFEGECDVYTGADLSEHEVLGAGEYVYIPQNVPHVAVNRSATTPLVAIIARADPNEQESVVLLPELEAAVPSSRRD